MKLDAWKHQFVGFTIILKGDRNSEPTPKALAKDDLSPSLESPARPRRCTSLAGSGADADRGPLD